MNEPLPDEANFDGFISEEGLKLTREIQDFVEQRKYQLEEALRTLNEQKNKVYVDNYVNVFLDMYSAANTQH